MGASGNRAVKKELFIVTSAITIAETCRLTDDPAAYENESKLILRFFENPAIIIRALDRPTAECAHTLTRTHGLKSMDAIHAATAITSRVSVMYTYDQSKGRRKGLLGHDGKIGAPPLCIAKPPDPNKGTAFDPKMSGSGEDEEKSATQS